jgi:hypothetical protein
MFKRADCTIVTTCRDRLDFLERALPSWRTWTPCPIVVVDYSCPRGTGAWAHAQGATVVYAPGMPCFNKPHALNLGLRAVETTFVALLDADTIVHEGFWQALEPTLSGGAMTIATGIPTSRDLTGFLAVETQALRAEPFDEDFAGWGWEDVDARVRLYLSGITRVTELPLDLFSSIPHTDELRAAHYAEKDLMRSSTANLERLAQKILERTGAPITELLHDPVAAKLLGKGLSQAPA